ncbi:MAG: ATP synthase subunit I [Jatrophihabitans sp.]
MVLAAVLGLLAIIVLSIAGHPLMAVFACLGLGLGALNNRMLQASVIRYGSNPDLSRKHFTAGVAARLGGITIVAIVLALLVRPDGLGTFAGLAVFQLIMLVGAALPVFRSLRPSA